MSAKEVKTKTISEVILGKRKLVTPNLFASYRLGDVTLAGVKFFPWTLTDTSAVLVNAYDLMANPKCKSYRTRLVTEKKTIREHIRFDGPMLIDSGAYYFIRNGNVNIKSKQVLHAQYKSEADVGVILDHPFPPKAQDKQIRINRTITNTRQMFAAHSQAKNTFMELLPVVHGHDKQTITATLKRLQRIADKYNDGCLDKAGIGSIAPLAQNGDKELAVEILTTVRTQLPNAWLHCFSMGSSLLMLLAFYCGVNTVDSQTWIMSAAFKYVQLPGHYVVRLATRERASNPYQYRKRLGKMKKNILNLYEKEGFFVKDWQSGEILEDPSESDLNDYIQDLTDHKGNQHIHNRACHNLWVFNFEARRARAELENGTFERFVEERLKDTKYYKAFLYAKEINSQKVF